MKKEIVTRLHNNFEGCAHQQDGVEYWNARELQELLGYGTWRRFEEVIERAKVACKNAGQPVEDHFVDAGKMVDLGSGASREINDIALDRYACYLIAQNGDPLKDEIAFAMTYFAVQTRKQEIIEQRIAKFERLHAREKLTLTIQTTFVRRADSYQMFPPYSTASRPFRSMRSSSLSDAPLGFFSPISHFCTVDALILRIAAKTAWLTCACLRIDFILR
jgi:hypothetical protein